jgi:hypothetical protein
MPTTEDRDRAEAHYRATKDEQGEPWTGKLAGVLAVLGIIFLGILALWLLLS